MLEHVVDGVLVEFIRDYLAHPYVQYTEHGIHAYFFSRLYLALSEQDRYLVGLEHLTGGTNLGRVCRVQKEYPTPTDLDESKRSHWDVCVLRNPATQSETADETLPLFDRLATEAILEFGLGNGATREHLEDDVRRLGHPDVRADRRYAVHLMRVSGPATKYSDRDASPAATAAVAVASQPDWIRECLQSTKGGEHVNVFVACTRLGHPSMAWKVSLDGIANLHI